MTLARLCRLLTKALCIAKYLAQAEWIRAKRAKHIEQFAQLLIRRRALKLAEIALL